MANSSPPTILTFSGQRAARYAGISYRQLDYWARTDMIRPSLVDATGSGSRRLYGIVDLIKLNLAKMLLDAGHNLGVVRSVLGQIPLGGDLTSQVIVISDRHAEIIPADLLSGVVQRKLGVMTIVALSDVKLALFKRMAMDEPEGATHE